jgi:hypothetical protein
MFLIPPTNFSEFNFEPFDGLVSFKFLSRKRSGKTQAKKQKSAPDETFAGSSNED